MTTTPLAELCRIVIAGVRNAGKSSLLNNLFQKDEAIISTTPGTTTDPVTRKIELGKLGMCAVTDTAGFDDEGDLGELRVSKTSERLETADLILFATPANLPPEQAELDFLNWLRTNTRPWLGVMTFADQAVHPEKERFFQGANSVSVNNNSLDSGLELIRRMESLEHLLEQELTPVQGLVQEGDLVLLVTPVDLAAPRGRLILPQVETIRDLLDRDCAALVVKERELRSYYNNLGIRPALVITDSQAFSKVAADLPPDQPLTSFSLLFARKKADPKWLIKSLKVLENFSENGRVLVMEACSHHRQADDLGTVKIPRLFRQVVGSQVEFCHTRKLPDDLASYDLILHCGGCMLSRKAILYRMRQFEAQGIPVINFGMFLAWANGLMPRALEPIDEMISLYRELHQPG
ncbi:[FeFe] hydrogenase H-cluster maturation GTPase HydF [Desulfosediminicola ganghwensis]|uniref:[FeFe] hydrogenase H-cluster maturation GTPase HydF n=1 Tax=Desulfosediminicola ganghwensis TaxID=2569540 RepID=UPI0010AB55BC|nr:[FeFe] hydrogenase H-cluster maturation GTPase HydF [Desulfosediminicola ganghwensis]